MSDESRMMDEIEEIKAERSALRNAQQKLAEQYNALSAQKAAVEAKLRRLRRAAARRGAGGQRRL